MNSGRILLVDDEPSAHHGLSQALHQAGFAVQSAADAFEALQLVEEAAPDLTICDLMMPGMNGVASARAPAAGPRRAGDPALRASRRRDGSRGHA